MCTVYKPGCTQRRTPLTKHKKQSKVTESKAQRQREHRCRRQPELPVPEHVPVPHHGVQQPGGHHQGDHDVAHPRQLLRHLQQVRLKVNEPPPLLQHRHRPHRRHQDHQQARAFQNGVQHLVVGVLLAEGCGEEEEEHHLHNYFQHLRSFERLERAQSVAAAFHSHRAELVQRVHVVHFPYALFVLHKVNLVFYVAPDAPSLVVAHEMSMAVRREPVRGLQLVVALAHEAVLLVLFVLGRFVAFERQAALQPITVKVDLIQRRHLVKNPFFETLDFVVGEIEKCQTFQLLLLELLDAVFNQSQSFQDGEFFCHKLVLRNFFERVLFDSQPGKGFEYRKFGF